MNVREVTRYFVECLMGVPDTTERLKDHAQAKKVKLIVLKPLALIVYP